MIQGLLYVPSLAANDPCQLLLQDIVPSTAVRRANLPPTNYNLVALAPWINSDCAQSFIASARLDPLRAMIVYLPGSGLDKPPGPDSDTWNLYDGGVWEIQGRFPIYAVPGDIGQQMMVALSLYSGSLEDIPFAQNISDLYQPNPEDYVRIWTELSISSRTVPTNLAAFFLVVLGVLVAVVVAISVLMHGVQRRRRAALRDRIVRGEVNLEALGIKRLTVPTTHIQTFPLYTYFSEGDGYNHGSSRRSRQQPPPEAPVPVSPPPPEPPPQPPSPPEHSIRYQPRCIICLKAFNNRVTIIRELSCGHIFHPDCIDEFLSRVSSLCPVCKASMLPRGSCPTRITNDMVRRERAVRELRRQADVAVVEEAEDAEVDVHNTDVDAVGGGTVQRRTRGHVRVRSWGSSARSRLFGSGEKVAEVAGAASVAAVADDQGERGETVVVSVADGNTANRDEGDAGGRQQGGDGSNINGGQAENKDEDEETTRCRVRERMRQLAGPSPEPYDGRQEELVLKYQCEFFAPWLEHNGVILLRRSLTAHRETNLPDCVSGISMTVLVLRWVS